MGFASESLLEGIPNTDVEKVITEGRWEHRSLLADRTLSCQIEKESGYPYNNPCFKGGAYLFDGNSKHDLGAGVTGGRFLAEDMLAGAFNEDGNTVVCGGVGGRVVSWDVASRTRQIDGRLGHETIVAICAFPRSPLIAVLTLSGSIVVGNAGPNSKGDLAVARGWARLFGLWLRNERDEAVVLDRETELSIWNTKNGALTYRQEVTEGNLTSCRFTPDLRFAFIQGVSQDMYDGHVLCVFDLEKRKCIFQQESFRKEIWAVYAFRCDGKICAEISNEEFDRGIIKQVLDLETGSCREAVRPDGMPEVTLVETLAPDNLIWLGRLLESGFIPPYKNLVALPLDLTSYLADEFESLHLPVQTNEEANLLTFNADGRIGIAAASLDGTFVALACDSGQLHFLDIKNAKLQTMSDQAMERDVAQKQWVARLKDAGFNFDWRRSEKTE